MSFGFSLWAGALLKASQALKIYLAVLVHLSGSCCVGEHSKWRLTMAANGYQAPKTAFELLLGTLSPHSPSEVSKPQAKLFLNQQIHSVRLRYCSHQGARPDKHLVYLLSCTSRRKLWTHSSVSISYLLMQNIQWILCYKYNVENEPLQASHDTFNKKW